MMHSRNSKSHSVRSTRSGGEIATKIGMKAIRNPDEIGAAAMDYLMYADYVVLAYCWAETAQTAAAKLATGMTGEGIYKAKLQTVRKTRS